ncbi:tolloid-like protein 1 isoform X2 [Nematostella vectensis]|uniref:tolloid-like protein 1 isoform X2 n=1 Tax=Nematostella vectensis TaxID=45351 RepID=UPI002077039B|nr:tolloid-like protein 1 isoform X2 [Nematostella vectensis]
MLERLRRSTVFLVLALCLLYYVSADDEDYDPCKAEGFIQGDIALTPQDMKRVTRQRRAATAFVGRLWPGGVIPFEIADEYTGEQKATILQAMRHWENFTCLSFIEHTEEEDFIYFHKGRCGCCSYVGRKGNGRQGISIGKNCDKFGIIVHEIGHLVGFWHEHTRPDRDQFVEIIRENIKKGEGHNFQKLTKAEIDSRGEEYDYKSIMHYGKNTFATSLNHVTILPKRSGDMVPAIGQREHLSLGDIRQTIKMYRCPECGRTLQEPSGAFTSPGYPSPYPLGRHCEWRISVTPGERIVLNFTVFHLKKTSFNKCKNDFVEVRDGHGRESNLIGRFCGTRVPPSIWSTGSRLWIKFKSDGVESRPGFKAVYETRCGGPIRKAHGTIQSPKYPSWYPSSKECVWTIALPGKGSRVGMRFVAFDVEDHEQCHYDYLQLFDGQDEWAPSIGKFCGKEIPGEVRSNSSYLTIKFKSDASINKPGFYLSFFSERNECNNNNGGCSQICQNTLGNYKCACYPGYELHSDGKNCEAACGGVLSNGNGTITSPSYPASYPKNKRCLWRITGPSGQRISLKFNDFRLEGNGNGVCRYDYVEVRDHENKILGRYCGSKNPETVTSPSNVMWVEFRSDHTQSRRGFSAKYYADEDECRERKGGCQHICVNTIGSYRCTCKPGFVLHPDQHSCKEASDCGSTVTSLTGLIMSPNFPGVYQHKKDCTWKITVTPGSHVELNFRIEEAKECRYDYVEVFSGTGHQAESLGRICGNNLPSPFRSRAHKMLIKFHSDSLIAKRGFKARYTAHCGANLNAVSQKRIFYSHPAYGDDNYGPKMKCNWTLTARNGFIKLRFKEFDIEKEAYCSYDYVNIRDGNSTSSPLLGKQCGSSGKKGPLEFVSTGNKMYIEFVTDVTNQHKGFIAEYVRVKRTKYRRKRKDGKE